MIDQHITTGIMLISKCNFNFRKTQTVLVMLQLIE